MSVNLTPGAAIPSVSVKEVFRGDQLEHANLSYVFRINRVVFFVKEERYVAELFVSKVKLNGKYLQVPYLPCVHPDHHLSCSPIHT